MFDLFCYRTVSDAVMAKWQVKTGTLFYIMYFFVLLLHYCHFCSRCLGFGASRLNLVLTSDVGVKLPGAALLFFVSVLRLCSCEKMGRMFVKGSVFLGFAPYHDCTFSSGIINLS